MGKYRCINQKLLFREDYLQHVLLKSMDRNLFSFHILEAHPRKYKHLPTQLQNNHRHHEMYQEQGILFHYMVSNVVDHLPNHTLPQVAAFLFREHHNSTQQSKNNAQLCHFFNIKGWCILWYFFIKNNSNQFTPYQ